MTLCTSRSSLHNAGFPANAPADSRFTSGSTPAASPETSPFQPWLTSVLTAGDISCLHDVFIPQTRLDFADAPHAPLLSGIYFPCPWQGTQMSSNSFNYPLYCMTLSTVTYTP